MIIKVAFNIKTAGSIKCKDAARKDAAKDEKKLCGRNMVV